MGSRDRAEGILATQKTLYDTFEQQEQSDEHMVYSEIKATRKQQEKLKADFNSYIQRTSNYNELIKAKNEQLASIENSRVDNSIQKHPFFHTTTIDNIQST